MKIDGDFFCFYLWLYNEYKLLENRDIFDECMEGWKLKLGIDKMVRNIFYMFWWI